MARRDQQRRIPLLRSGLSLLDDPGLQARRHGGEPDAGRRLLHWAREAGAVSGTPSAAVWCFAAPTEREWRGETWASRISEGPLADSAVRFGLATPSELAAVATAWNWSVDPDGWFTGVHAEVLISV